MEGKRNFTPEKKDHYPEFGSSAVMNARPKVEVKPSGLAVTSEVTRVADRTQTRDEFNGGVPNIKRVNARRAESTDVFNGSVTDGSGRSSSSGSTTADSRFSEGTTTQATYRCYVEPVRR